MTDEELKIVEAMTKYGGSFVRALAEAFYHADPINFINLQTAFMEYWVEYEKMTKSFNK